MASYHSFDYGADFYIKAPISFEMMRALAENPQAIAEGASGAPRVAIAVGGKTAIATENLDPTQVLRPDGNGGVAFGPDGAAAQMWDAGPALTQAIGNGAGVAGGMAVRLARRSPARSCHGPPPERHRGLDPQCGESGLQWSGLRREP